MFQNLHRKMTFFCTLITGFILICMTLAGLLFFEALLKKNDTAVYEKTKDAIVAYLENKTIIDYEQLSKVADNKYYTIALFENGNQLSWSGHSLSPEQKDMIAVSCQTAYDSHNFDVKTPPKSKFLTKYLDFSIKHEKTERLVSFASLPDNSGSLCVLIIYSRNLLNQQITSLRCLILFIDLITLMLLFLFAWKFSARILKPVAENREKQTQFVAAASHELRSPLSVILSSITALEVADEKDRDGFFRSIESEGQRMTRLIDDMLTLAGADNQSWSLHFQDTQLDTLLLNTYEKYQPYARKCGIRLNILLPEEELPHCLCDAQRIEQVLSVLLDNAIHYSPGNGEIALGITGKSGYLKLWVTDNGPGIPIENRELVFERFFRADSSRKDKQHFGLGLCIAKEIIELHHGKIWIESHEPSGAVFCFTLPLGKK